VAALLIIYRHQVSLASLFHTLQYSLEMFLPTEVAFLMFDNAQTLHPDADEGSLLIYSISVGLTVVKMLSEERRLVMSVRAMESSHVVLSRFLQTIPTIPLDASQIGKIAKCL